MKTPCMLACNKQWTWDDIQFPCGITPKIDGVRVIVTKNGPRTRNGKCPPSLFVEKFLSTLPVGTDGEFISLDESLKRCDFHRSSGDFRTKEFTGPFLFFVFDKQQLGVPYILRVNELAQCDWPQWVRVLVPLKCEAQMEIEAVNKTFLDAGYEGSIIRDFQSMYKFGRATLREKSMFKLVEWVREEAIVKGFTENTQHNERIGAIVAHSKKFGSINVGSGFGLLESHTFKKHPNNYIGKTFTFKYKLGHCKDKPQEPIFCGWRDDI